MIKGFRYYYVLIFLLVFVSFFSLSENLLLSYVFRTVFVFSLGLCSLFFVVIFFDLPALRGMVRIYLFTALVFLLYAFAVLGNGGDPVRAIANGLQFMFSMVVIYLSYSYSKKYGVKGISGIALLFLLISIFLLVYHLGEGRMFFQNPNTLGMISYLMICSMLFFRRRLWLLAWSFGLALVLISGSRASLLGLMIFSITYVLFPLILRLRLTAVYFFSFVFATFVLLLFSVGILFPELTEQLNQISRDMFQKNLDSGRNSMWITLIELMVGYEVWGRGGGVQIKDISDIEYSAHNLYLQVYMQVGVFGVIMLIGLLFSIWKFVFSGSDDYKVRVAGSAFMGLLVINCFEVTLFQNNLALSLPILALVGLAAGSKYSPNNIQAC